MSILKASLILFCCSVYAGQVQVVQTVNPAATSLYQLCIHELAQKPGADYSAMPLAIQEDLRPLQQGRFVEDSIIYEELRARGLQEEKFSYRHLEPYSETTQEAIAFAYKHFPDSEVSCATEVARGYVSLPRAVHQACYMQFVCCDLGLLGLIVSVPWSPCLILPLKLILASTAATAWSACGTCLGFSGQWCFKKQCLEVALPHYNPPRAIQMDLNIPDGSFGQREQFPVDEDTSGEDVVYNDGARLLEDV